MDLTLARALVGAVAAYLAVGVVFAVPLLLRGLSRLDPDARGSSAGFRLIIAPGVVALWPLLAWRWARGSGPPEERNAHRAAAQAAEEVRP